MSEPANSDYRKLVRDAVLDADRFIRLTLSEPGSQAGLEWDKIVIRPVKIKEGPRIQCEFFGQDKSMTKNFTHEAFPDKLDELLSLPFSRLHVQTAGEEWHIRITQKGHALISRGKPSTAQGKAGTTHDREKKYPLPLDGQDDFLQAIGIKNEQGQVRPSMQAKFRQINGFISLVEPVVSNLLDRQKSISMVDCGCGSAHLTFALFHYLRHIRKVDVTLCGVDRKKDVLEKSIALRDRLGWAGLDFEAAEIAQFQPKKTPDLVLSLHACDTATDEAIAQGIQWGSFGIIAAPCCQHELHHQIKIQPLEAVSRHGILRERLADIFTDTFRALILRIMGYRTQVIEFVAPDSTPKNLMIRAEKTGNAGSPEAVREYLELKKFLNVTPVIESLVGEELGLAPSFVSGVHPST